LIPKEYVGVGKCREKNSKYIASMTWCGVWGQSPQRLAIFQSFNENNTFLGIFGLNFRLKIFS